jgi:single-stranded-DNA-specific exonuclease
MKPDGGAGLPPPPPPRWVLRPPPEPQVVTRLVDALSLPSSFCGLLAVRGYEDPDRAKAFLRPRWEDLPNPEALRDLPRAVERIAGAIDRGETLLVHGDYDVDGVCSAALLTRGLRRLGARVHPFVPHRFRHGYDLGEGGLEAAQRAGASLIVTCDSGIRAVEAVRRARGLGIDVVVTDHHTPDAELPPAWAVVNPSRSDCPSGTPELCGAGVAFQLLRGLSRLRGRPESELTPDLDLVALATVADLVPLVGANRILVRFGLRTLARTEKPGLLALMQGAGVSPKGDAPVDAGQVGFLLAPRLNAAGRVGDHADALHLLLSEDAAEAARLAQGLEAENVRRKEEDRDTLGQVLDALVREYRPERDLGVVLAGEGWHPGVIGIVASRVVERIHRPVVLVALEGDRGRGSARSIPEVHLHDAVEQCRTHLTRFGGHRQAAGMDLPTEALDAFRVAFNQAVAEQLPEGPPRPILRGDVRLPLAEINADLHHWLRYLEPHGIGNPRPTFFLSQVELGDPPRRVGDNHLKLRLGRGPGSLDGIGFGLADRVDLRGVGREADLAIQLRENDFRGRRSLEARILDLCASGAGGGA